MRAVAHGAQWPDGFRRQQLQFAAHALARGSVLSVGDNLVRSRTGLHAHNQAISMGVGSLGPDTRRQRTTVSHREEHCGEQVDGEIPHQSALRDDVFSDAFVDSIRHDKCRQSCGDQ